MHDFITGLHITALGMGVVFVGLVLLAVAVKVTDLVLNPRKIRERRAAGVVVTPLPSPVPKVASWPAPATDAPDGEVMAAVAASLACVMDERGASEAGDGVRIAPALVAAITAAIVAREEARGGTPLSGRMSIRVQKGALG
ncbi:MAG: OadG family protein [Bacillota bacterium]|nr:OadG family protein [Bacillota bacterium]